MVPNQHAHVPVRLLSLISLVISSFLVFEAQLVAESRSTNPNVAHQIAVLLERAKQAESLGHLINPPGANAAELYAEVLRIDPENTQARGGLDQLRQTVSDSLAHARHAKQTLEVARIERINRTLATSFPKTALHPDSDGGGNKSGEPRPVDVEPEKFDHSASLPHPPPSSPEPPPSRSPDASIEDMVRNLANGSVAFNTPASMKKGETQVLQLLLSGRQSVEQLRQKITASGTVDGARLKISDFMEAKLTGENFKIEPGTDVSQAVAADETTEWNWQVTPMARGAQHLELSISVVFHVDNEDRPRTIQTLDRIINVDVDLLGQVEEFIEDNWQWLWTAILIPVGALVISRIRKSSKNPRKPKKRN